MLGRTLRQGNIDVSIIAWGWDTMLRKEELMDTKVSGSKELFNEVIDTGLCALCGACVGGCPYLVPYKGRIVLLDNCTLSEGQCYQYCPRTYTDMNAISQQIFGAHIVRMK